MSKRIYSRTITGVGNPVNGTGIIGSVDGIRLIYMLSDVSGHVPDNTSIGKSEGSFLIFSINQAIERTCISESVI